jgi:DNA-binding NarL/FixJ family response regulator
MSEIRIHIVDDHPVVRRGLRSLLSNHADFVVVGESATVAEGKTHIAALIPDVVLLDVRLPGASGLDLLQWLREQHPKLKVLILTSFDDEEIVLEALQRGAHGFILKNSSDDMLCDAIRAVYRNGRVLSPKVTEQLIEQATSSESGASTEFTAEEFSILRMLVAGASNDEMAQALYISVATLKRRLQKIFSKLNVANRSTAIAETIRRKLLV